MIKVVSFYLPVFKVLQLSVSVMKMDPSYASRKSDKRKILPGLN